MLEEAVSAGATVLKEAEDVFFGRHGNRDVKGVGREIYRSARKCFEFCHVKSSFMQKEVDPAPLITEWPGR